MNILLVLIPLTILFGLGAVIAFFWAVDHDQFDDMETPRLLPLLDAPHDVGQEGTKKSRRPDARRDNDEADLRDPGEPDA
jgi:cbb3-type cytochrome oxidase maturation protein